MTESEPVHENNTILESIHTYGIDPKNREIFLHSYMSDNEGESGVDYRAAVNLEKNIRYLSLLSNDPILIHMHLPGGEWEDCMAMYDTIRLCKSKIIILAYGKVHSSSSVIFQSPNLRILMPNANMLIHYGSVSIDEEHSKAATSNVQWSERESDKMIDIFTDRCMNSRIAKEKEWKRPAAKKHIKLQLASKCDWILPAEEAVYNGFADGILGDKKYPHIDSLKKYK
jgi:ATP-dependent protease ClpP protease subunit